MDALILSVHVFIELYTFAFNVSLVEFIHLANLSNFSTNTVVQVLQLKSKNLYIQIFQYIINKVFRKSQEAESLDFTFYIYITVFLSNIKMYEDNTLKDTFI